MKQKSPLELQAQTGLPPEIVSGTMQLGPASLSAQSASVEHFGQQSECPDVQTTHTPLPSAHSEPGLLSSQASLQNPSSGMF